MAKKNNEDDKTNVCRLLDQKKIAYTHYSVPQEKEMPVNGVELAQRLNLDVSRVFKTLVTVGKTGQHYVFMVPVAQELDLKKAAAAAGEKSIEMIPQKELLPLTGYVHGGCSPIGMKKVFPTVIHESAGRFETIFFSAGRIGHQVELPAAMLEKVIRIRYADIIK